MERTASELDLKSIWHPYTQMKRAKALLVICKAKGAFLYTDEGKYLDACSSWWVNLHGHCHPHIVKQVQKQAEILEQVIFAGCTHMPAIDLAVKLLEILPGNMSKIFYTDNGSTSVEAALKMALQYFYNKNPMTKRVKIISFKGGYHGDTFGAMSAAGKNGFNKPFWSHLFEVFRIDPPLDLGKSLAQLRAVLNDEDPACFIFEPLILGAHGMIIYPKEHLDALLKVCKKHTVITIADEVMTGFGRTSTLFATEALNNKPDIICLSKGLTGGFLPLGVTACKEFIYNAFLSDSKEQAFLHGHSFTANPIACRAALANLELLLTKKCYNQRKRIEKLHAQFCSDNKSHPKLKRLESIGTILVVEYKSVQEGNYFDALTDKLYSYFLDHEILVRPLGNVLYLMPPYCITSCDLKHIYKHILYTLETLV